MLAAFAPRAGFGDGHPSTAGSRERLHGFVAWALWSVAHIFFLIGFGNRVVVSLEWIWSCLPYRGGARLITGERRG